MKINIDYIIEKYIISKYTSLQDPKFTSQYTAKELSMWQFTYELGRYSLDKDYCDTENDSELINHALDVYFECTPDVIKFTINEWIDFLNKFI